MGGDGFAFLYVKRRLAAPIDAALLGKRYPFALAFTQQGPLEVGECAHHGQHQLSHRRVFAGELERLLDELDAHAREKSVL